MTVSVIEVEPVDKQDQGPTDLQDFCTESDLEKQFGIPFDD